MHDGGIEPGRFFLGDIAGADNTELVVLDDAEAIIPGEAAGVPDVEGRILPEFLQSYTSYMDSLEKLAALDVEIVCIPHNGILTEDDAKGYVARSIEESQVFRDRLLESLDEHDGDQDEAAKHLNDRLYSLGGGQPKDSFDINLRAMVKTVAREFG